MEDKGSIIGVAILVLVAWLIFKPDYSKPWIKTDDTEFAYVQYCELGQCSNNYTLEVTNIGKSAVKGEWIFELEWPNGGLQEASVACGKDDLGRFCSGIGDGGRLFRFRRIK